MNTNNKTRHFLAPIFLLLTSYQVQATTDDINSTVATGMDPSSKIQQSILLESLISNAVSEFEKNDRHHWSYKLTRYENEEGDISSSIELFDPGKSKSEQWSLLRINGELPSQKQQRRFVKDKQKESKSDDEQNLSISLRKLIVPGSLKLLEEDSEQLTATFAIGLSKLGEDASKSLSGHLLYDKQQGFIREITVTNHQDFSPIFSATISDFKMTLSFIKKQQWILPSEHKLAMKGTFALFTEIDEVSTDTFSEYRYIPKSLP